VLKINKNATQILASTTFNQIYYGINQFIAANDELTKNLIEGLSIVKHVKPSANFDMLKINVCENREDFQCLVDKENMDMFMSLFEEIQIFNKNVIIKEYFNENCLKSMFPYLNSYNIFEGDNIIFFNHKDCSVTFYFLTKLTLKNNDFNYQKRYMSKILNKLLLFIKKITNFLQSKI
jgi:hypothetical protein